MRARGMRHATCRRLAPCGSPAIRLAQDDRKKESKKETKKEITQKKFEMKKEKGGRTVCSHRLLMDCPLSSRAFSAAYIGPEWSKSHLQDHPLQLSPRPPFPVFSETALSGILRDHPFRYSPRPPFPVFSETTLSSILRDLPERMFARMAAMTGRQNRPQSPSDAIATARTRLSSAMPWPAASRRKSAMSQSEEAGEQRQNSIFKKKNAVVKLESGKNQTSQSTFPFRFFYYFLSDL